MKHQLPGKRPGNNQQARSKKNSHPEPSFVRPVAKPEGKRLILPYLLVLFAVTFILYFPALKLGFTNWDDPVYVLQNQKVHELNKGSIEYFFSHASASNFHPLTMISLSADYNLSLKLLKPGDHSILVNAFIFHAGNLALHLMNVILVFLFIFYLTGRNPRIAFISALLFGIHPMHVESVAWISERKDVLYAFFFLAGLIIYLKFISSGKVRYYVFTLIAFILSVLSKPAAVIFPLVLLCLEYYNGRKFSMKLLLRMIPFLFVSVTSGIITIIIQSSDSIASFEKLTIVQRSLCVSYGFVMYILKLFYPTGLSAFYPYPSLDAAGFFPFQFYIMPVLVLMIFLMVYFSARKTKVIPFGFLFYLVSVILVLQIITVGTAIMADRYSYIAYIGPFFILAFYTDQYYVKWKTVTGLKFVVPLVVLAASSCLFYLSLQRISVWQDSGTLWTDAIAKFPDGIVAHNNRGNYFSDINKTQEAKEDFEFIAAEGKGDPLVYRNLGNIYIKMKQDSLAIIAYSRSLELNPQKKDSNAYICYLNRGNLRATYKQYQSALDDFSLALGIYPGSRIVQQNRAHLFMDKGDFAAAVIEYSKLISMDSLKDDFYLKRGYCNMSLNNYKGALQDLEHCLKLNPGNSLAYFNMSIAYYREKKYQEALKFASVAREMGIEVNEVYFRDLQLKTGMIK